MAEKQTLLDGLIVTLQHQETVTELFKLANSDDFKQAAHTLSPDDLKTLRNVYRACQAELDGKVKLADFVGQRLSVFDIGFWHSGAWDNDGVTLRFTVEGSTMKYKALTSSAPVVRWASNLDTSPTPEAPVRIELSSRPVSDEKRAAQGQRIFSIRRLPALTPRTDGSEGSPF